MCLVPLLFNLLRLQTDQIQSQAIVLSRWRDWIGHIRIPDEAAVGIGIRRIDSKDQVWIAFHAGALILFVGSCALPVPDDTKDLLFGLHEDRPSSCDGVYPVRDDDKVD